MTYTTTIYVKVDGVDKPVAIGECEGFDYTYEGTLATRESVTSLETDWTMTIVNPNRAFLEVLGFTFPEPSTDELPAAGQPTSEIPAQGGSTRA